MGVGEGIGVWVMDDGGRGLDIRVDFFCFSGFEGGYLFCLRGLDPVYVRLIVWLAGWLVDWWVHDGRRAVGVALIKDDSRHQ